MKQKSINIRQFTNGDVIKENVTNKDSMDIYTEKFPGYNLSIFSWYKLTSAEFSDDFLKCVGKLDDPEKFVNRMIHVKLKELEIEELNHLAYTILDEDFTATDIIVEFEDLMFSRTKTTTLVFLNLGYDYENIIKRLIPYGIKLKSMKKSSLMELDWEGNLYFRKHAKSNKCGSVDQFTKKVLKIAAKK